MAYIDTGAYNKWRRAQEQAAATEQYNVQKAALDQKYENKGLGGLLGDIVGGIGKTIGDVGKGVGGLFGTAGASIGDIVNSIKDGKLTNEGTNAFKRYWYGGENDADAAAKAAGTSLNAATTLASTVLPGVGAGTTAGKIAASAAANTAAGALGGIADEFQQQGQNASFEGAANRAISGAVAGLATGGLNRKIGNATSKAGSALLNNKLATSAIGRGALSGAVGGSVGAGTSAALAGQDVGQAALQGGLTGAVGGAAQAGIMNVAGKVGKNVRDAKWEKQQDNNFTKAVNNPEKMKESVYLGELRDTMRNATKNGVVLDTPSRAGNATMGAMNPDGKKVDIAYLNTTNDGNLSLESLYPERSGRTSRAIKNTLDASQTRRTIGADGADLAAGNISALQGDISSVSQNSKNVKNISVGEPKDTIKNRNKIQRVGDELQQNARETKWQGLYESLDPKTARRAAQTKAPQQLESLGISPENYEEYAKTSNYVNEQISKLAKDSGVKVNLPDLPDRLSIDNSNVVMSDQAAKKYNNYMKKIVADGNNPSEYSASYLLEKSRELGDKAVKLRGNTDDVKALRAALTDAKYILRDEATKALENSYVTGDDTTAYIAEGLRKMGANQDVIDYYSAPNGDNAPNASDYIRRTALFEQAREMAAEMGAEKLTRNASKGKSGLFGELALWTGLDKPLKTIGKNFVAPVAAKGQELVGKAVSTIGDNIAPTSTPNPKNTTVQPQNAGLNNNWLYNYLGRTTGLQQADDNVQNLRRTQEYQNLEDQLSNAMANIDATYGTGSTMGLDGSYGMSGYGVQNSAMNQLGEQMATISNAMNSALAAGDMTAYTQLADLYKSAYNTYQMQAEMSGLGSSSQSKMTTAEKNQLAKLQSAGTALDELEALYQKAGGGQGIIGGNIANFLGGLGLNSDVNTYNQLAQGLINQIGAAIGKTDSLNTEGEVQRALSLVPKITDDNQTAMNKLATLRSLLQTNTGTYNQLYGA